MVSISSLVLEKVFENSIEGIGSGTDSNLCPTLDSHHIRFPKAIYTSTKTTEGILLQTNSN